MKSFAGMRTLDEAYRELKQLDSGTAVSKYFIRQLALSGKIPTVMCGRKRLINFDGLLDYLNEQGRITHPISGRKNAIRKRSLSCFMSVSQ